jgi:uncharacterized membrane protein required for colicin V production
MNFMNIIDIILYAILAISLVSGMYKGFIASSLAFVGFGASFFGAMNLFPRLSAVVQGNQNLMGVLKYYLDAGSLFKTGSLATATVGQALEGEKSLLNAALQDLNLPSIIESAFQSNVTSQAFAQLNLTTLSDYLSQTIWMAVINVVSFLILFTVCYVLVLLVVNLLNNVFRFPLLKHLDWLLGGAFGVARGVLIVMLVLSVAPLILSMVPFEAVQDVLNTSTLAQALPSNFAIPTVVSMAFQPGA